MSKPTMIDDTEALKNYPSGESVMHQVGVLGRARVAVSDGSGTNITSTAGALDVNVTGGVTTGLTDAELRASPVPVTFDVGTEATFDHGSKTSIGTTPLQMVVASTPADKGVVVKSVNANSGTVYVGNSDVTLLGVSDATDGFEIGGGESITLPVDDANKIWVVATVAGQAVTWATA